MRARELFYGREKPRALWRVMLYLAVALAAFLALAAVLSRLFAPWEDETGALTLWSAASVAALSIASYVMMRWMERRPFAAIGTPWALEAAGDFLRGSAIGGALMIALVAVQTAMGWLEPIPGPGAPSDWPGHAVRLAVLFAFAAAAEELLFRGYPFQVLVEGMGPVAAVGVSSAAFALLHASNPAVGGLALANIGLAGVLMAVAYLRTRSLWVSLGLHWSWNWVMAAFDLPVSGHGFDAPGYDVVEAGPDLVTGGAFGPEAGLAATAFLAAAIFWALRTRRLRESERMARLRPLVDRRLGVAVRVEGFGGPTEDREVKRHE